MLEHKPVQARSCICPQELEQVQRQTLSKQYSGKYRVLYTVRSEISCDFLFVFYTDVLGSSQSNQLSMIIGLYEINYELNTDCL